MSAYDEVMAAARAAAHADVMVERCPSAERLRTADRLWEKLADTLDPSMLQNRRTTSPREDE